MHECVHKKMCNGFYFMLGIIEMEKQTNKHMLNDSKVYSVVKYIYICGNTSKYVFLAACKI